MEIICFVAHLLLKEVGKDWNAFEGKVLSFVSAREWNKTGSLSLGM